MPDETWPGEVVRDALGLVIGPDEGGASVAAWLLARASGPAGE